MFAAIAGVVDHLVWLADQIGDRYEDLLKGFSGRPRSLKTAMHAIEEYGRDLSRLVLDGQGGLPGLLQMRHVKVYGLKDLNRLEERDPTFAFKMQNMRDQDVVERLWTKYSISMRAEDYYSRVPRVYDVSTMIRASLVHYNTPEEIAALLKGLHEIDKS